jgi:hypothetical protein
MADIRLWSRGPLAGLFGGRIFFLDLHHDSLVLILNPPRQRIMKEGDPDRVQDSMAGCDRLAAQ